MAGRRARPRGRLEAEVMEVLWSSDDALTATQVRERMPQPVPAQTTVLTALERLRRKHRIVKVADLPRGSTFAATRSEADHLSAAMLDTLTSSGDRGATLLRFAGQLGEADLAVLRRAVGSGPDRST